jgi:hypothetical protein
MWTNNLEESRDLFCFADRDDDVIAPGERILD